MRNDIKWRVVPAVLAISMTMSVAVSGIAWGAPVYKDVPTNHWAKDAIIRVVDMGIMAGDTTGNFKPNGYIDKFETSKTLAKAAGYKYTDISAEERAYFDQAYNSNKSVLTQYGNAFSKWNITTDREIAFLMDKGILTVDDLNQFVIKDTSNKEQLRALSRQEAAAFIVRLMGKKNQAINGSYTDLFKDDASITASYKPYVYYLKNAGIVSGTNGNFNPKDAVTRATLAVMLDKAIGQAPVEVSIVGEPVGSSNSSSQVVVDTVTGKIDKFYPNLDAVQIITNDNKKNIYRVSSAVVVYVDGNVKSPSDLQEGMPMVGVISNNELVDIKAQSVAANTTPGTTSGTEIGSGTAATVAAPAANIQLSRLEGIVTSVSNAGADKTIGIEIRMINPRGEIITEVKSYTLASECTITRGGVSIAFETIEKGDVVTAEVSGGTCYSLALEEKERSIKEGTLTEKKFIEATQTPILVIQDKNGSRVELRVTNDSYISRKDIAKAAWSDLRIGDSIDATAEYDVIKELYAYGIRSSVDGYVEEIHITKASDSVVIKDYSDKLTTYHFITGLSDVYTLRSGMKVRLRLDSQEIESVTVLEEAGSGYATGYIRTMRNGSFTIRTSTSASNSAAREIQIDDSTVFIDSKTGSKIKYSNLYEDMKVYVVFRAGHASLAKTITVLSE